MQYGIPSPWLCAPERCFFFFLVCGHHRRFSGGGESESATRPCLDSWHAWRALAEELDQWLATRNLAGGLNGTRKKASCVVCQVDAVDNFSCQVLTPTGRQRRGEKSGRSWGLDRGMGWRPRTSCARYLRWISISPLRWRSCLPVSLPPTRCVRLVALFERLV